MKRVFVALLLLLFAASLLTGVTEVRPGERAVVRRFGRVLDEKPKPGLWIGLPWGIDRVDRVPVDLARQLGGPLITYDGTQHTAVFNGDRCVDAAVMRYFVDGTLPPASLRCR